VKGAGAESDLLKTCLDKASYPLLRSLWGSSPVSIGGATGGEAVLSGVGDKRFEFITQKEALSPREGDRTDASEFGRLIY
jgi:hypothetical protein